MFVISFEYIQYLLSSNAGARNSHILKITDFNSVHYLLTFWTGNSEGEVNFRLKSTWPDDIQSRSRVRLHWDRWLPQSHI